MLANYTRLSGNYVYPAKIVPFKAQNTVPVEVENLFAALPKAELHLHLSGSTPKLLVQEIMRENGIPEAKIQTDTDFKSDFKGLDGFLDTYYKVAWVVQKPEHFEKAAYQICRDAARENVKYLEIRTSLLNKEGTPGEILKGVTKGIKQARKELKKQGFNQTAKIIILAQRHHSPEESIKHAQLAINWAKKPGSLVVGFDLAGPEDHYPISLHRDAITLAKQGGLNITLHAGETTTSIYKSSEKIKNIFGEEPIYLSGADSIKKAVEYGAHRVGHALHLYDSPKLVNILKDLNIAIESPPKCNVQLGNVKSYKEHPIKKMLDDGLNVCISTDNRTVSSTNLTNEYKELYKNKVITDWKDIKKLVINAAKSAFLPNQEKEQLVGEFKADLRKIESNPLFRQTIDKYLNPSGQIIRFGFNNKSCPLQPLGLPRYRTGRC